MATVHANSHTYPHAHEGVRVNREEHERSGEKQAKEWKTWREAKERADGKNTRQQPRVYARDAASRALTGTIDTFTSTTKYCAAVHVQVWRGTHALRRTRVCMFRERPGSAAERASQQYAGDPRDTRTPTGIDRGLPLECRAPQKTQRGCLCFDATHPPHQVSRPFGYLDLHHQ